MLDRKMLLVASSIAVLAAAGPGPAVPVASAQEAEKELGWFATVGLTGSWVGGNSSSATFGADAGVRRVWTRSELKLEGGGTRTESTRISRAAVGTTSSFEIDETENTEKTAELYFLRGRYDRSLSPRFFVFGGTDWLRNTFAGIKSRTVFSGGAGNVWMDLERRKLSTDYGLTYTFQDDVVENPDAASSFAGLRTSYDFWSRLSESTQFSSVLIADLNLDNTDDLRLDLVNSVLVSMSKELALRLSHQILWRNDPSLERLSVVDGGGTPTGESVLVPLDKTDSVLRVALVVEL